jgi:uncharacterized membrane protein YdcZ (DUF606 family)
MGGREFPYNLRARDAYRKGLLANIVALYFTLKHYFGFSLPFAWSAANFAVGAALLAMPQYFLLLYRKRFKRVARGFAHEGEWQSVIGGVIVGVLVLLFLIGRFPATWKRLTTR